MKMKHQLLTVVTLAMTASAVLADNTNKVPNWGTDILHYFAQERFTNNGVESNANAVVSVEFKEQGNAKLQKFDLVARKLSPNTPYTLLAAEKGETNYSEALQFTTDANGTAKLKLKSTHSNKGQGNGNGNQPLPSALDPVLELGALTISDVNTQTVMQADLNSPDRIQYLIKRTLTGDSAAALLQISGTTTKTHFRLSAVNLAPTNSYYLAINESIVQTNSTDAKGRLRINALTTPVASPLEIKKVALLDLSTNTLLSTELP
ncbi:MAG: hypothetical protein RLY20_3380 [Verrucomicrobiota bacterium]|jgi:hypothetical protein